MSAAVRAVSILTWAVGLTQLACAAPPPHASARASQNPFSHPQPPPTAVASGRALSDDAITRDIAFNRHGGPDAGVVASDPASSGEAGARGTAPNLKRWKFASFFRRVKKQVNDHWHPDALGIPDRNRLTILRVRLRPDGKLIEATVEQGSGIGVLDDEAVAAMMAAQPFPNPPLQLVTDGEIRFRFGFRLDA